MVCRFIGFSLVVLKLLVLKVCEITGISKIEFLNFSETESVKQNQKRMIIKIKTIQNLLNL